MKLIMTPTSPFARKARILIIEKGLQVQTEAAVPWDDAPAIVANNPMRKVPILLTDDGNTLTGSTLICEYLDAQAAPHFLPQEFAARMAVKARDEIAQSAMESLAAIIMAGRVAPEMKDDKSEGYNAWRNWLLSKVQTSITHLAAKVNPPENPDMADLTLACLLDFIALRMPTLNWQTPNPKLEEWHKKIQQRPSIAQTTPPPA